MAGDISLSQTLAIQGDVYLAKGPEGSEDKEYAFLKVDTSYQPAGENGTLSVYVENDFDGRVMIQYPENTDLTEEQINYFAVDDYILSVYDLQQDPSAPHQLTLQKLQMYFMDGINGNDSYDGSTPAKAFRTLEGLYNALNAETEANASIAGTMVYVVHSVDITEKEELVNYLYRPDEEGGVERYYKGYYKKDDDTQIPVNTQITFMRYLRPENAASIPGYENADTCLEPLFKVSGSGNLILKGLHLEGGADGTSYLVTGEDGQERITAPGCADAKSPLIQVNGYDAKLDLSQADEKHLVSEDQMAKTETVRTTLRKNNNFTSKPETEEYLVGMMDGQNVYQGSSAGVEILNGAEALMDFAVFADLTLGGSVTGGSDVYSDGVLKVSNDVDITGSLYLEGLGEDNTDSSRYINLEQNGRNWAEHFDLKMRDPYFERMVAKYKTSIESALSLMGDYLLEEIVNDYYFLGIRESDKSILELSPPPYVYIDGVDGQDKLDQTTDVELRLLGTDPKNPVKTLRRAYELMQNRSVNVLYVVDTVTIG